MARSTMFVVAVDYAVRPANADDFREAVIAQARNSLEREDGCHQFDVCTAVGDPTRVFLYEVYTDAAAFEAHKKTPYFADFSARVAPWVAEKRVETFDRVEP